MPKLNLRLGKRRNSAVAPPVKELHFVLNHGDSHRITEAVRLAELQTSAEIMVKLSAVTSENEPVRAIAMVEFTRMGLNRLKLDNGVLIYISLNRHAVEIVVGNGAADKLPQALWDNAVAIITQGFRTAAVADGIIRAVEEMAKPLSQEFPPDQPDAVDLPNVTEE